MQVYAAFQKFLSITKTDQLVNPHLPHVPLFPQRPPIKNRPRRRSLKTQCTFVKGVHRKRPDTHCIPQKQFSTKHEPLPQKGEFPCKIGKLKCEIHPDPRTNDPSVIDTMLAVNLENPVRPRRENGEIPEKSRGSCGGGGGRIIGKNREGKQRAKERERKVEDRVSEKVGHREKEGSR